MEEKTGVTSVTSPRLSTTRCTSAATAFFTTVVVANFVATLPVGAIVTSAKGLFPLTQVAPGEFACRSPTHHDGDAIRCGTGGRSMRLYGIDAPEMPGACRAGRRCAPGDPYAAREHLTSLTRGQSVACRLVEKDRYRRSVVQCRVGTVDLSCAMIRDRYAVQRYGRLKC